MYAEERQQAVVQQVVAQGRMSVAEIAALFAVTTETVRRDLTALEALGLVRRVHGGAVPASALTTLEPALGERDAANVEAKGRIARAALELLPPAGASILLDAGSTTSRLADAIPATHRLVVFTHSVSIAARLAGNDRIELHLLPGRVRPHTHAAVGATTVAAVGVLRVDMAFMGANGVSVGHGFSTPDSEEAATKRAFVLAADRVVGLVDATKVGVDSSVRFAALDEVDVLVTDASIQRDDRAAIAGAGIEVVVA
ncbi:MULTISPECIES: DeoR/GlpR family DNA-binding transcription regulator [unclassified Nocardioides]|uniref:DeoR/GlpR family DNA-binding transcription regulator n=1 Tax=unclassified Nocardioides TaxID=2615069 RepID=UPI0006F916E8|nr:MULTISPECIES: DeoR/GlpR family DNA-binding transcription regulator [unclassified Nocardioides]KRA37530.1 D-beta-D-heptose 1-phosphate adenosyltransferase [Nocardioides sp. Root614]KRA91491.1 D-beta-D-heptose 1-phosphate adenosyltransferase [Nocardioides sp. Root682]